MNPQDPHTPNLAIHGERPCACVLGELYAAAERVADANPTLADLRRLRSAFRKAREWMAYNVCKQDEFAMDLARGVRCAHLARPTEPPITDGE
jgi:hypothetical protein